jgi:hypothetical protein
MAAPEIFKITAKPRQQKIECLGWYSGFESKGASLIEAFSPALWRGGQREGS